MTDWVEHAKKFVGKNSLEGGPIPLGRWMGNPKTPTDQGKADVRVLKKGKTQNSPRTRK